MTMYRKHSIDIAKVTRLQGSDDRVVSMAFSSDAPYKRWWGIEVLDHSEKSIRLDRLNDGASLLFNHDWSDLRGVHVPGTIKSQDGMLRGDVKLTAATQTGRDTIALVESGVLSKASVGYQIHKIVEQSKAKDGKTIERELDGSLFERVLERSHRDHRGDLAAFRRDLDSAAGEFERDDKEPTIYRVVDWEPFENSLVTVPADPTVGVGRSGEQVSVQVNVSTPREGRGVPPPAQSAEPPKEIRMDPVVTTAPAGENAEAKKSAYQLEEQRKQAIVNLCKANRLDKQFERHWIESGSSLDAVADEMLKVMEERGNAAPTSLASIGLTDREISNYSWFRALRVLAAGSGEIENARKQAGFELEASRAVAKKLGRDPAGLFVPFDVQRGSQQQRDGMLQRDMTAYPGGKGGYLVSADNISFVEILRNRGVLTRMGAVNMSGLEGSVTIPRQTGAATLAWQNTESTAVTSTDQTLGQLSMTPKNAIAVTNISRQLMMQSSPSAEQMIRSDLAAVVALGVDLAGIQGSGGAQPIGILNTAGITTGITGTTLAYAGAVSFQTSAASANALMGVNGGYVTTPTVAGALMGRSRFANTDTPLWDGNVLDGQVAGFRAMSTLQIPASNMLFGEWSQVVIGEWGVLELALNPYQNFNAALFALRAIYSVDILVRYPQAFALSTNVS